MKGSSSTSASSKKARGRRNRTTTSTGYNPRGTQPTNDGVAGDEEGQDFLPIAHEHLGPVVFSFLDLKELVGLSSVNKIVCFNFSLYSSSNLKNVFKIKFNTIFVVEIQVRKVVNESDQTWAEICATRWHTKQKTFFMRYWWPQLSEHVGDR